MKISASADLPAAPDAVFAMRATTQFQDEKCLRTSPAEHSVAIDELSEAIRVTNNLKDPDIFSTMVRREITGKDFSFFASFGTPGYDLEKTFVDLSKKDFEMSLTSSRTLEDRYLRTLAVIAVASTCAKNTKPGPKAGPKVQSPPRQ